MAEFPAIIELNVGGHYFATTLATLTACPDSMLASMFSGRMGVAQTKEGAYFIDRDGTHFAEILNFLRDGRIFGRTLEQADVLEKVMAEAHFYAIQPLIDAIVERIPARRQLFLAAFLFNGCVYVEEGDASAQLSISGTRQMSFSHPKLPREPPPVYYVIKTDMHTITQLQESILHQGWYLTSHCTAVNSGAEKTLHNMTFDKNTVL